MTTITIEELRAWLGGCAGVANAKARSMRGMDKAWHMGQQDGLEMVLRHLQGLEFAHQLSTGQRLTTNTTVREWQPDCPDEI